MKHRQLHNRTTTDYIDFDYAHNKAVDLLESDKTNARMLAMLIETGIRTGLRISDLLQFKHEDFRQHEKTLVEKKTKNTSKKTKFRVITLSPTLVSFYRSYCLKRGLKSPTGYVFLNSRHHVMHHTQVRKELKKVFGELVEQGKQISTHTLRKTFGRGMYNKYEDKTHALIILMDIFNHSSLDITKKYIGLTSDEIRKAYLTL